MEEQILQLAALFKGEGGHIRELASRLIRLAGVKDARDLELFRHCILDLFEEIGLSWSECDSEMGTALYEYYGERQFAEREYEYGI
tara:strand:- start:9345 stop:9602 length:258 start_codon:yes stop_codon:yes gene_type:complete